VLDLGLRSVLFCCRFILRCYKLAAQHLVDNKTEELSRNKKIYLKSVLIGNNMKNIILSLTLLVMTSTLNAENSEIDIQKSTTASLCRTMNVIYHNAKPTHTFSIFQNLSSYTSTASDGSKSEVKVLPGSRIVINEISCDVAAGVVVVKESSFYTTVSQKEGQEATEFADTVASSVNQYLVDEAGQLEMKRKYTYHNQENKTTLSTFAVEFSEEKLFVKIMVDKDDKKLKSPVKRCGVADADGANVKLYCHTNMTIIHNVDNKSGLTQYQLSKLGEIYDDEFLVMENGGWKYQLQVVGVSDINKITANKID
jgi:hypothetical protein